MKRFVVILDDWENPNTSPLTIHIRAKTRNAIYKSLDYYLTDHQKRRVGNHFHRALNEIHIAEVK